MIILSLVQTSINRKKELFRFITSLNNQINVDLRTIQLIFVDQGDNKDVFKDLDSRIIFDYIRIPPSSLSHARNIGIQKVKGKYICFPDDDCWLEANTYSLILGHLSIGLDGLVIKVSDEKGKLVGKFPNKSQYLSMFNHCSANSNSIFLKFDKNVLFDEKLGVGSSFGFLSGEETDYLIRYMKKHGENIYYNKDIIIHHPNNKIDYFSDLSEKKYGYGKGWGCLLRKHKYPLHIKVKSFIRPVFGIILYFILGEKMKCKNSIATFKGRIDGYLQYK